LSDTQNKLLEFLQTNNEVLHNLLKIPEDHVWDSVGLSPTIVDYEMTLMMKNIIKVRQHYRNAIDKKDRESMNKCFICGYVPVQGIKLESCEVCCKTVCAEHSMLKIRKNSSHLTKICDVCAKEKADQYD
jgi:hypothetical protein